MKFKTKSNKGFYIAYKMCAVLFALPLLMLLIDKEVSNPKEILLIVLWLFVSYLILIPSYRSGSYEVVFQEGGFKYKCPFSKGFVSYQDVEEIVYVKTRGKTGWFYTVEVILTKGKRLHFSTTFLSNSKERERFKREWRMRTGQSFRHRKGYILY